MGLFALRNRDASHTRSAAPPLPPQRASMDLLGAYADSDDEASSPQPAAAAATAASSSSSAKAKQTAATSAASSSSAASAAAASSSSAAAAASSAAPTVSPFPSSSLLSSSGIDAAPDVPLDSPSQSYFVNPAHNTLYFNPKAEEMYTPLAGPFRPGQNSVSGGGRGGSSSTALAVLGAAQSQGQTKNHQLGFVEPLALSNFVFEDNYHAFLSKGVAVNPSVQRDSEESKLVFNSYRPTEPVPGINPRQLTGEEKAAIRLKRKAAAEDPSDVASWAGPWASRETEADIKARSLEGRVLTEEQKAEQERVRAKKRKQAANAAASAAGGEGAEGGEDESAKAEEAAQAAHESTTFHGAEELDYQGRTYMSPPSTLHVSSDLSCYLPKRLVHTFTGHTKGVNAIRFLPVTGHVLLSASNDKTMKIWNVVSSAQGGYKCLRTIAGHTEAVRSIDFNHDGRQFASASYDKFVKVWDTETGTCVLRHWLKKVVPICVKIHPEASNSHEILIGQQNKLVTQLDTRSNEIVQTYNEHLGPVNSITFIDGNRRFVSSSDDKKIFVWEYGIPVVIKHIAEPDMHSMPYIAAHPSGKHFVGQSQDNQILVFTAVNKYKIKRVREKTHTSNTGEERRGRALNRAVPLFLFCAHFVLFCVCCQFSDQAFRRSSDCRLCVRDRFQSRRSIHLQWRCAGSSDLLGLEDEQGLQEDEMP